ncbi:MAG: AMP-binding protein [Candidatus Geothermincolia bacterium]
MAERNPALISNLLEIRCDEKPDAVALIFENGGAYPDEKLTYREILDNSMKLAAGLTGLGFQQGDKLALLMRNVPEIVYALAAASFTGLVVVPIDPRSKGEKLAYQLQDSNARGVITTADLVPEVEAAATATPELKEVLLALKPDSDPLLADRYRTVDSMLAGPALTELPVRIDDPTLPLEIIYTSGVTGNPKGVQIKSTRTAMFGALAQLVWKYTADDVLYTGLSLTHGNAQAVTMLPALTMGIPAVISQRFTKSRIWDVCRTYGCTTFSLLGGMMAGIWNEPPKENDADNPVRMLISAGTPRALWEPFEKRFDTRILEWYGAVEGGFAYKPVGEGPIGSFGKPLPGIMEMVVVDESDREVPAGTTGELICRQAGVAAEVDYYGKPEASAEKTRGGWLRTGDMVHADADGWFYFDYRKGGALRRQGDFIKPDYVETVLGEHPAISEICVYGIPAASGAPGESDLVAAVSCFAGKSIDPGDFFAQARRKLEGNSVPSWLQVVDEIPKSVSEKFLDRVLKDAFAPGAANVFCQDDYR